MAALARHELQALTEVARDTWSSGDFNEIARSTMPVAEDLVRAADPSAAERVLDIACGSGNAALVAARRFSAVSGIDLAENLIERAKLRAAADGSEIDFRAGDAQALPFPDASFDVVLSAFGVMFAPDQQAAANEALRVCRPGGRIVLANWMPRGFGIDFFGAHARHAPPPEGAPSPLAWGNEEHVRELFGDQVSELAVEPRQTVVHLRSVAHGVELYARYFGPTIRALEKVGPEGAPALKADLAAVVEAHNVATDGSVAMRAEYALVTAVRA